ncbi:MAG TPA: hypothetical protein VK778_09935 [Solirubrobacteraceae bacterium]|nr:hypothetical protein [Solirubrobacteraceae bacterium]
MAFCLSLSCGGTPAWAGTAYVDGISDQSLTSWAGTVAEASGSRIELARYVVQWDVMSGVGYPEELANLRSWYDRALELRLTPELALDNYNCDGCEDPKGTAEYTSELEALFRSFPGIKVVEAWNEPNDAHYTSYLSPTAAAQLMNAAYSFCAAHGCTAIAGDLLDSEPSLVEYEEAYERGLAPRDPGNWGIHPYHAVKYMSDGTLRSFREALPSPATDHIWFTEAGAYYCEAGRTYGERSQEEQARFLMDDLMPEFQPTHVFYYDIASSYGEPPACDSQQSDTALYAATGGDGPLVARSAASVIFGSPSALSASAGSAATLQPTSHSYLACEPALDEQWQRRECSLTLELFEI